MTGIARAPGAVTAGDLEIEHGGAIAIDTEQLREVGARLRAVAAQYEEAGAAVVRAGEAISSADDVVLRVDVGALRLSGDRIDGLAAEIDNACVGTLLMADAFEVVELRAQAEALSLTDAAASSDIRARAEGMVADDERVGRMADWLLAGWERRRFEGLGEQYDLGGMLPPVFLVGALVGLASGHGKVRPGAAGPVAPGAKAPNSAPVAPLQVTPVKTSTPRAPNDLAGAFRRIPGAGAQVAVEKYTMAGGTTRYVAYVAGTQSSLLSLKKGAEPWDMTSNIELYQGAASASYQATLDALAAAGVEPGDRVDVVAHSQGGMIATRLAVESDYEVSMQITAGSPTEPTLGDEQTLIQLRHTDDVVSALAAGGSAEGTGSPDSFTASRVGDPADGIHDLQLKTHGLETYIETAEMVDASTDPRAVALDEYWDELGRAVEVERTEYRAERTE
ncbi:hypothetical protein RN51_01934 [Microbacterium oxydans]|uniref:Alpha/beta hydrolase family protein n=1 Tax=Microbacterium oxydans TaxID=82380 RepID=A0A0F0KPJ3_9MICO|nr:hypothetical protein [Microbacterium oxydans]KJL22055.1 hypothetical protein RN51_01934 [Microbacterium oxydans]